MIINSLQSPQEVNGKEICICILSTDQPRLESVEKFSSSLFSSVYTNVVFKICCLELNFQNLPLSKSSGK